MAIKLKSSKTKVIDGNNVVFEDTPYQGEGFSITINNLTRSQKTEIFRKYSDNDDNLDFVNANKELFKALYKDSTGIEIEVDGVVIDPEKDREAFVDALYEQFDTLSNAVIQAANDDLTVKNG